MQLARKGVVTLCTAWLVCVAGFSPASLFLGVPKTFGWRAAPLRLCCESRCALRRVYAHLDGGPGDVDENLKVKLRKAASKVAVSRAADTLTVVRSLMDKGEWKQAVEALVSACLQGAINDDDVVSLWRRTGMSAEAVADSFVDGALCTPESSGGSAPRTTQAQR